MIKLITLGLCFSFSLQTAAWCNETNNYSNHLSKVASKLLHVDYKLVGGITSDGINTPGLCDSRCKKLFKTLELGKVNFIQPIIYTNSPEIFLAALTANTPCKDLSVLSYVDSIEGMGYSTDEPFLDFFRPTNGFAIYKIKIGSNRILLLRAENYEDSGGSAESKTALDVAIYPADLQRMSSNNSVKARDGEFIELKSDTCSSVERIIFDKSSYYDKKIQDAVYENDSWIANPIIYDGQIYILNSLVFYPYPKVHQDYTEYAGWLTDLTVC